MKHTVVLVLSHSKNPQSCVPIGESGFAVFPLSCNLCFGGFRDFLSGLSDKISRKRFVRDLKFLWWYTDG